MTQNTANHQVITGIAAALAMSTALAGCTTSRAAAAHGDPAAPLPVTVTHVAMTEVASVIDVGGVVQARTTATISARVMAPVREIRVSPGDQVRKGQTLIVLIADELAAGARAARSAAQAAEQGALAAAAELEAAEAALALARANHDRVASLQAKRSATAQELDDATGTLRSAEARVTGASARLLQARSAVESAHGTSDQASTTESFTTIAAPFDGMVTEKMVEPGNMASPGMPLLRLEDTGGFRLDVHVDESRAAAIGRGDHVPVWLGTDSSSTTGTVAEISRAVDAGAHAFLVKVALPDGPGLRSGVFGRARFAGTPRRALTIPSSSIVRHGQVTSVFVVERDVARVRLVNLSDAEVLAGLVESEVVVLSPPAGLTDGRRVRVGGVR
jgi:RND family efflux transporter MFP subunit